MSTTVAFENDRVRVLRVTHQGNEKHPQVNRQDRLVIYLEKGSVTRTVAGKPETLHHEAGEVVWRDSSQHQVENLAGNRHEVIIVELK